MLTDVDLPAPGLLWTRWATVSATLTGLGHAGVWSIDDRGATLDDRDGGWARFALLDGRRAVLYGLFAASLPEDLEHDLLTGAPDWLPWDELTPLTLGFVIWHENGRWSRVRYRDGFLDGMTELLHPLLTADNTIAALLDRAGPAGSREAVSRLLASSVRAELTADDFRSLLGDAVDTAAALAVATRAGLVPGSSAPRIPPGRRPPMRRVRRLSQGEHDRLVWAAMQEATELRRPAPPGTDELQALVTWLRDHSPGGDGHCTLLAYADATSFSSQPGSQPPADEPGSERYAGFRQLTDLVRSLRRAESDPRYGRWLYLRVETSAGGFKIERRYDSWPAWWHDDGVSGPWRTNLQEEMEGRLPAYRPSWVRLLDPEVAYRPIR